MKILIINIYYYPNNVGGTESVVKNIAEGLVKRGHEVAVFSADSNEKALVKERIHGVSVYRGCKGKYIMPVAGEANPLYIKIRNNIRNRCNLFVGQEFEYVCDDFCPDVIHTHNLVGLSTQIWKLCGKRGIPLVHTIHDYWLLDKRFFKWAKKNAIYPAVVTAPSEFVLNKFVDKNFFINATYRVVKNGLEIDFDYLQEVIKKKLKRTADDRISFLYVGQLGKIKGIDLLLDSFCKTNDLNAELTICGKGFLEPIVEAAEQKDSRVHYLGQVKSDVLGQIYDSSDVLIVPSVWDEPFGMVAIEAYSHGMTVIAGRRGGLAGIVNSTGVGMLIDPENISELKEAIVKYTDRNVINNDIRRIPSTIGMYSLETQLDEFESIYHSQVKQ